MDCHELTILITELTFRVQRRIPPPRSRRLPHRHSANGILAILPADRVVADQVARHGA